MIEWVVVFFLLAGAFFVMIATIGVMRFPDTLTRMHAATKAGSFGVALMLVAACLHWGTAEVVIKSILIFVFFYVTTPVASQLLSRAAYRRFREGLELEVDEWAEAEKEKEKE
jgi:multicomponent Na+:H+ antiporter subunit G